MKRGDTKAGMKANIRYFIKWSALALVIGSVAGAAGTIFSMGVSWFSAVPSVHAVFSSGVRPFDRLDVPLLP